MTRPGDADLDATAPTPAALTLAELHARIAWLSGLTVYPDTAQIMPAAMSHQRASTVVPQIREALAESMRHLDEMRAVTARLQRIADSAQRVVDGATPWAPRGMTAGTNQATVRQIDIDRLRLHLALRPPEP